MHNRIQENCVCGTARGRGEEPSDTAVSPPQVSVDPVCGRDALPGKLGEHSLGQYFSHTSGELGLAGKRVTEAAAKSNGDGANSAGRPERRTAEANARNS
jgi:hypothetical protein